jgi:phage shock protein C
MSDRRTTFYLDKQNRKFKGVCAGIADYTGTNVLWVRIGFVAITLISSGILPIVGYILVAWLAQPKPQGLYETPDDAKFWQQVRQSPARTTRDTRSKLRDIDRRLADVETYYTSRNSSLANEIESLR